MFNKNYKAIVAKVSNHLLKKNKKIKNLFCLVSGPQGSGKTTFTNIIKKELVKKKKKSSNFIY